MNDNECTPTPAPVPPLPFPPFSPQGASSSVFADVFTGGSNSQCLIASIQYQAQLLPVPSTNCPEARAQASIARYSALCTRYPIPSARYPTQHPAISPQYSAFIFPATSSRHPIPFIPYTVPSNQYPVPRMPISREAIHEAPDVSRVAAVDTPDAGIKDTDVKDVGGGGGETRGRGAKGREIEAVGAGGGGTRPIAATVRYACTCILFLVLRSACKFLTYRAPKK